MGSYSRVVVWGYSVSDSVDVCVHACVFSISFCLQTHGLEHLSMFLVCVRQREGGGEYTHSVD